MSATAECAAISAAAELLLDWTTERLYKTLFPRFMMKVRCNHSGQPRGRRPTSTAGSVGRLQLAGVAEPCRVADGDQ